MLHSWETLREVLFAIIMFRFQSFHVVTMCFFSRVWQPFRY
jgi:hypothetical protein